MPNHYAGDLLHTIEISGHSRVRTELLQLAVVPTLAPHPVQMHRQLPRHRYLRDLPSAPHRQVEESTAPLRLASYRDLRCFHQQKPEQRVALLADVPQSPAGRHWTPPTAPVPHSWPLACRSGNVPEFQLPTRRRAPSTAQLPGASSAAASPDASLL